MATNADPAVDDSKTTEEDLRNLKYGDAGVENSKEQDEPAGTEETAEESDKSEEDGQTEDQTEEESQDDSQFVKELPNIGGNTVEEYARNLEKAYQNSTTEALRLKGLADQAQKTEDKEEIDISNPLNLYAKQKMDEEIKTAFTSFSKDYSQVNDPAEYNKFTSKVAILSRTIMESESRLASPEELYSTAAVILGWDKESAPTNKEKIGMAVKNTAAVSKTSSAVKQTSKSKVTDEMIAVNRTMYPGKTDAQIREELEPYVK